jgi:signal transduction histidine kinase/ligand-binding sensor domain-containing protein/CheY-like chemotaxis protein
MKTSAIFKKITIVICPIIILLCSRISIQAQQPEIKFDRVLELGSPGGQTTLQDNDGFLWIGTEGGGIFRYDGYELKNYGAGDGMLSDPNIFRILEDPDNPDIFWVGTLGGLNRFDKETETFTWYQHNQDNPDSLGSNGVNDIVQDGTMPNILWIATLTDGLNKFDKNTETFTRYGYDPNNADNLNFSEVWRIIEDKSDSNILWLSSVGDGLVKFEKETESFTHYAHSSDNPQGLKDEDGVIGAIVQDKDQPSILWLGTMRNGLVKFDKRTETFNHYRHDPVNPDSISETSILLIYDDGQGRLWLGSPLDTSGLTLFDKRTETFTNYKYSADNPQSLSSDLVMDVYEDRAGTFWITTYSGTVDKIDPYNQNFTLYQNYPSAPNSLSNNTATSIYEDRAGNIWLGTQGGLNRFDRKTGAFLMYTHNPDAPESLDADYILGAYEDSSGTFWVSQLGGPLVTFDRGTGKVNARYQTEAESFTKIIEDPDNPDILWLGTRLMGFAKFEKGTETFTFYTSDAASPGAGPNTRYIYEIVHDRHEPVIWLGGWYGGGLNKFEKATETFTHYSHNPDDPQSLSTDSVAAIYQDTSGIVWVGTKGGGLNKFEKATGTFTRYAKETGISSDVNAILEDREGKLWLSTNYGIVQFNPETEAVEKHYDKSDGLQGDAFLYGSVLQTRDGEMWFGGTNGVNSFYPDKLTTNPYVPPVVVTALTQGGQEINWDNHKVPGRLKEINLDWRHNFFEFGYTALNFTNAQKNRYKYMLEGFDQDWYEAGDKRTGRYSGLPGGTYTLRILGSNNDGVWNEEGVSLKVTVVPPFWQTWWFQAILIILVVGGIAGGFFLRVNTINTQKRQLEIQVAERTRTLSERTQELSARTEELAQSNEQLKVAKEKALTAQRAAEVADQAKSAFLANMSHELRTPLHAVLGFSQLLAQNPNLVPDERENVDIITRSGEHLLRLINQLLDLSKIEAGRMILQEQNFDLSRLLDDVVDMFRLRAEEKHLQFLFERTPDVPRYVRTDEAKLRQVLINLLDNAFKFTNEGGVAVRVGSSVPPNLPASAGSEQTHQKGGEMPPTVRIFFEIEDTGPGIAPDELDYLFEAFVQTKTGKQVREGTGLGLSISRSFAQLMGGELKVKSEVRHGTLFLFDIYVGVARASDIQIPPPTRRVIGLEPDQPRYRILIVDDKWNNRQLLLKLLSPLGFDLREAANGQEAIDIWDTWVPHLIWMDMRMPVMDGYKTTERIKATTKGQATAIIALTASAFDEEKTVVLSAGCDDFLRKPFKQVEIFDLMQKHLGVRYLYEEQSDVPKVKAPGLNVLTPEALAALPDERLTDLRQAIETLNTKTMNTIIDRIRQQNEQVADALAELVKNYQFDTLLALFEEIM